MSTAPTSLSRDVDQPGHGEPPTTLTVEDHPFLPKLQHLSRVYQPPYGNASQAITLTLEEVVELHQLLADYLAARGLAQAAPGV